MTVAYGVSSEVNHFLQQLYADENFPNRDVFIFRSSNAAQYKEEVNTWGAQRGLNPQVIIKPVNLEQVQAITKALYPTKLDFAVRNGGVGSTSARHVLVSLANLNAVSFDEASETVTVGAGALWTDVDGFMASKAPGWAVVSARTGFVGVTGIVLIGGLSWLSHEFGLISDPQNLLDVQIVLADGRVVWASEEDPDLLWAVRGGRCAFGIITQLKLRARRLEVNGVYSAQVFYPISRLQEVSRAMARHIAGPANPRMAMHAFFTNTVSPFFPMPPSVGLILFDRGGIEHAHSSEGYKWAFDIPDATVKEEVVDLFSVNRQTDYGKPSMGKLVSFDATGVIDEVDDELLIRAKAWYDKTLAADPALAEGSYFILERCQEAAFGSTSPGDTAWPHGKPKQVLQLGVGYIPDIDHDHLKETALQLVADAFQTIPKTPSGRGDFSPTFFEPSIMGVEEMYGSNLAVLEKIANKYDQNRRFRSLFKPNPNF